MKTVNLGDVSLQVHDEGSGPPVLFVHGFPCRHAAGSAPFPDCPRSRGASRNTTESSDETGCRSH